MSIGSVDEVGVVYGVDSVVKLTNSEGGVEYCVDSVVKSTRFRSGIFGCGCAVVCREERRVKCYRFF